MANQFDIVENLNASTRKQYPFLIILQHDRVNAIQSVIAAPLVERTTALAGTKIHPEVVIDSQTYIVLVEQLAAIPRKFGAIKWAPPNQRGTNSLRQSICCLPAYDRMQSDLAVQRFI